MATRTCRSLRNRHRTTDLAIRTNKPTRVTCGITSSNLSPICLPARNPRQRHLLYRANRAIIDNLFSRGQFWLLLLISSGITVPLSEISFRIKFRWIWREIESPCSGGGHFIVRIAGEFRNRRTNLYYAFISQGLKCAAKKSVMFPTRFFLSKAKKRDKVDVIGFIPKKTITFPRAKSQIFPECQ